VRNEGETMDEIKETKPEENWMEIYGTNVNITSEEDLASFFKNWDHNVNKVYMSDIPQICKDEPCQLGIDEAGRGPILGPMIYGIVYTPLSEKQLPVDLGCADSKTLTQEQRHQIFNKICEHREKIGWAVEVISPNTISNSMYQRVKFSLNDVSMKSAIELTQLVIERGANIAELYVDTVGKPEAYQIKLENIFPDIKVTVAKKADSVYPIVSAASICAKVLRDSSLKDWQFREGTISSLYGCGYPNDPDTKKWLFDNVDDIFGFPRIVRFSWSPAERMLQSHALSVEWQEVEEEEGNGEQKITIFFAGSSQKKRHQFFIDRCLSTTATL
ncbi:Ribonuclease H2 subunit A, partial [Melipona quadrifasciata]